MFDGEQKKIGWTFMLCAGCSLSLYVMIDNRNAFELNDNKRK